MNVEQVFLVDDAGNMICEEVGPNSYHDITIGKLFKEEVDPEFPLDERIHSDNAAKIVSEYHYLVIFETREYVPAMFPVNATIEQKVYFFNHFYSRNQNLPEPKIIEAYIRVENNWEEIENIEYYLNDFETKLGGRK